MSSLAASPFPRGARVVLAAAAPDKRAAHGMDDGDDLARTPRAACCLRPGEVGTVVQVMRDALAWRRRREHASMLMVRGPRGETTVLRPAQLAPAPVVSAPALPVIVTHAASDRGRRHGSGSKSSISRRGLLRSGSNGSCGCPAEPRTPLPVIVRTPSYDATEDASDGSDVEGAGGYASDSASSDSDPDPNSADEWAEIVAAPRHADGEAKSDGDGSSLLRTRSQVDAGIRIAYWRDPVKVAQERRKHRRLGTEPPQTVVLQRLRAESAMAVDELTTADILGGKLTVARYACLCVPGGFATNYLSALGDENDSDEEDFGVHGGRFIQEYVNSGGGFVGICAGAYCGSNWGWGLIDVDVVDIEHWCRGMSQRCVLAYTDRGHAAMGVPSGVEEVVVRYANGPILALGSQASAHTHALAIFRSDFARKKSSPVGVMRDSPAIVASDPPPGRGGRVVLISPHPEDGEPWTKAHFRNLFRWACREAPDEPQEEDGDGGASKPIGNIDADVLARQKRVRGEWWRTLPRQDAKRYPPLLRDHGVPGALRMLNQEAAAAAAAVGAAAQAVSATPASRRGPAKATQLANKKLKKQKQRRNHKPLLAWQDGYSLMVPNAHKVALPFVDCIAGPILVTAPHGLKLAGPRRSHLREKYTSELALLLAKALAKYMPAVQQQQQPGKGESKQTSSSTTTTSSSSAQIASFCVWNYKTARKRDPRNLDPNFLYRSEWPKSPFHTALLKFRGKWQEDGRYAGTPCFHVDFHGKRDRSKAGRYCMDIGMEPWLQHPSAVRGWTRRDVETVRDAAQRELDAALAQTTIRGKACVSNPNPRLHGWWGDDDDSDLEEDEECETTMTHQAVLEGIPSMQFETPGVLRRQMMLDPALLDRIAKAIAGIYCQVCEIESGKRRLQQESQDATRSGEGIAATLPTKDKPPQDAFNCRSFFVYGSLRPDDTTGMPWRDRWLRGCLPPVRATLEGRMYEDTYASVVLPRDYGAEDDKANGSASGSISSGRGATAKSTVTGYLVEFPADIYQKKLKDGDDIEGCPDLYQRVLTEVRCVHSGQGRMAWAYVRPNCARDQLVPGGDWVRWQMTKHKKKQGKPGARAKATVESQRAEVQAFLDAGCPEYRGQVGADGKAAFASPGGAARMIDAMVRDCRVLEAPDPDRQV